MRAILIATSMFVIGAPAWADIHPMYHERNKAAAASVAVVDMMGVTPRLQPDHMGECDIRARVVAVERGDHLTVGQILSLVVDCYVEEATLPSSGIQWQEARRLQQASRGRVWLNADGSMLGGRYFHVLD